MFQLNKLKPEGSMPFATAGDGIWCEYTNSGWHKLSVGSKSNFCGRSSTVEVSGMLTQPKVGKKKT
jgi:hypothetical protein